MVETLRLLGDPRGWVGKVEMSQEYIKVLPAFTSFFELPLSKPLLATWIHHCPVGVVVTESRLWVTHLSMLFPEQDTRRMWPDWKRLEPQKPKAVFAFGNNMDRLIELNIALADFTQTRIDSTSLPEITDPTLQGCNLLIQQSETNFTFTFFEVDNRQNQKTVVV